MKQIARVIRLTTRASSVVRAKKNFKGNVKDPTDVRDFVESLWSATVQIAFNGVVSVESHNFYLLHR